MHVLIVEDSYDVAVLLNMLLTREHKVRVTIQSDKFDEVISRTNWDSIDAVVADQFLDEYDGKVLLKWLEREHPRIRRIMLTADVLVDVAEAHADTVLIKPVLPLVLFEALGLTGSP